MFCAVENLDDSSSLDELYLDGLGGNPALLPMASLCFLSLVEARELPSSSPVPMLDLRVLRLPEGRSETKLELSVIELLRKVFPVSGRVCVNS